MKKKEKRQKISKWFREGKIKVLGNGCYSIPSEAFILGITPTLIKEVLK